MSKKRSMIVKEASKPVAMVAMVKTETLQAIREEALRQHFDISKTIAELDELSSEINATLAFLRARRGDKL